jgi:SPFH domain / Band 7 family
VIGSMDLEQTLTSRETINTQLRGVLDDASGKWGIRVTRVELRTIDPPQTVKEAMEKQMRADREKRATILTAEGVRAAQILTAEGDKQGNILRAEGDKQSAILKAEGQASAIQTVFQSIHRNDPDPKLLAYQYLQTLPQIAQGPGNTVWMVPSELTSALKAFGSAFGGDGAAATPAPAPAAASAPIALPPEAGATAALPEAAPNPDAAEALAAAHKSLEEASAEVTSAEVSGDGSLDGLAPVSVADDPDTAGSNGAASPA